MRDEPKDSQVNTGADARPEAGVGRWPAQAGAEAAAKPVPAARNSGFSPAAYYRQGVLVPGGPPTRSASRSRKP